MTDKKFKKVPITAAKEFANKFDKDQVIIVTFVAGEGYTVTSYGKTKEQCRQAARGAQFVKDAIGGEWK